MFSLLLKSLKKIFVCLHRRKYSSNSKSQEKIRFFDVLPNDILEQILLRLPLKSLKTSKSICKHWHSLITGPQFIEKRLSLSIENDAKSSTATLCFLWKRKRLTIQEALTYQYKNVDNIEQELSIVTIHSDVHDVDIKKIRLPPVPIAERYFPKNLRAAHCNGVLCFFDSCYVKGTVFFCNLELGEFKLLRTPRIRSFKFSGAGFGYDCKAREYKFVKFFSTYGDDFGRESKAKVHTLGTDSNLWREIDLKGVYCLFRDDGVYCNGFYYWTNMSTLGSRSIVSFDMCEEKIRIIELPQKARKPMGEFFSLTIWNGLVAIFISTSWSRSAFTFEMWVMEQNLNGGVEDGFGYSWNKRFTIGPLVHIYSPLAFWKDDELLLQTIWGQVVSHNIRTQLLKVASIPNGVIPPSSSAISCLKSLVSVN